MSLRQKINEIVSALYSLRREVDDIESGAVEGVELPWGAGTLSFKKHSRGIDVIVTRDDGTEHVATQIRAGSNRKAYLVMPTDVNTDVFAIQGIEAQQGEKPLWKQPSHPEEAGYQWSRFRSPYCIVDNPDHPYTQYEVE